MAAYAVLPFYCLYVAWRYRGTSSYQRRWKELLGFVSPPEKVGGIWVHASSLGEVITAEPLVKLLLKYYPERPLLMTCMVPTGSDRIKAVFGDMVWHAYAPLDTPDATARFLRRLQPSIAIVVETELWLNRFVLCRQYGIPVMIANARLSPQAMPRYHQWGCVYRHILQQVTLVAAKSKEDGERFIELGLQAEHLQVAGDMKFDIHIPNTLSEQANNLREQWGADRLVWIASSTHEGEEAIILDAFQQLRKQFPTLLLVLVPRHPERFSHVTGLAEATGFAVASRSHMATLGRDTAIFIGDTMGELLLFYAASDIAFVGGSLVPVGGHNLLEPAALGLPCVSGPHLFNAPAIQHALEQVNALRIVEDGTALATQVSRLLNDKSLRRHTGDAGLSVIMQNRGAVAQHVALLRQIIPSPSAAA